MNSNQVKGSAKDAAGSAQRKLGEMIDSPKQQAKGAAKQVEGKTQKGVGDVQERVEERSEERAENKAHKDKSPGHSSS